MDQQHLTVAGKMWFISNPKKTVYCNVKYSPKDKCTFTKLHKGDNTWMLFGQFSQCLNQKENVSDKKKLSSNLSSWIFTSEFGPSGSRHAAKMFEQRASRSWLTISKPKPRLAPVTRALHAFNTAMFKDDRFGSVNQPVSQFGFLYRKLSGLHAPYCTALFSVCNHDESRWHFKVTQHELISADCF